MMRKKARLVATCLTPIIAVCALTWMLGSASLMASAAGPESLDPVAVNEAVDWLIGQQQADGSFGLAGQTAEAVLALVSAGRYPALVITDTRSPLDFLALEAHAYSGSGWDPGSQTALLVQAVVASGQNPYDFGGLNLVDRLYGYYDPSSGSFGLGSWSLASYIMALDALKCEIPITAVNTLKGNQLPSGAWEFLPSWGADLDTTGKVLQALAAAGEPLSSAAFASGTAYLSSMQQPHGGWNPSWDASGVPNPNSTAQVVLGLLAAGQNPLTYTVSVSGCTPIDALMSVRNPATGALQFWGADNILATAQAIPALQGQTFPRYGRGAAYPTAMSYVAQAQLGDGGFAGWSGTSDASATLDVVLGGVAADLDPRDWAVGGITTPLDYLAGAAPGYVTPYTYEYVGTVYTVTAVAQAGKLIAGVVAAEGYTTAVPVGTPYFAGIPLKSRLDQNLAYSPADNTVSDYAWAAIGYVALGEAVPAAVTNALLAAQEPSGGWSYYGDYAYATSLAVQGLVAAGVSPESSEMVSATDFLRTLQDPGTGGFVDGWGTYSAGLNAVSTANVLQAVAALGLEPYDFAISPSSGTTLTVNTPDGWLLSQQSPAGDFGGTALATGQVLQGLGGRALPIGLRPVVVSTGLEQRTGVARNGAFRAVFNVEPDPASVDATTFRIEGPGGSVPSAVSSTGRTATLTPTVPLQADETYRLTISGVRGARQGATGPAYHWDITTAPHRTFLAVVRKQG